MLFSIDPGIWLKEFFIEAGLTNSLSSFLSTACLMLIVVLFSWLSNIFAKVIILKIVTRIVKKTSTSWDDIFLEQKVFTRLSHIAPALIIWFMAGWAFKAYPIWLIVVHKLTYIYIVLIGMVVVNSFIEAWHKIYLTLPISQHRHIKGYVQLVKIFIVIIAALIIISVIFKKEVSTLIAGLSAMAAVIILVFRDTLLGLVASIQLSANNMLRVGDWITIPGREVDGIVTDITLNTVKVQNFDKTIITVPTYSLVNESFQNWKGMEEAGARQIKRPIFIDIRSIKFPDKNLINKLKAIPFLNDKLESFVNVWNSNALEINRADDQNFSSGQLTNLGIFRYYAEAYLKNHPTIDKRQAIILRHKAIEGNGLPLQVNVFTNKTDFVNYENVQSEIFEHLLAMLNEFDLKAFQKPTGDDLLALSRTKIKKNNTH
jgi:miniconductance mechanosensitive channel